MVAGQSSSHGAGSLVPRVRYEVKSHVLQMYFSYWRASVLLPIARPRIDIRNALVFSLPWASCLSLSRENELHPPYTGAFHHHLALYC